MNDLLDKKCVPCEGGVIPFDISEIHKYQKKVDGWEITKNKEEIYFLSKKFEFENFLKSQDFVNEVGKVSEELHFDEDTVTEVQKELGKFVLQYQAYTDHRNHFGKKGLDIENINYGIQIDSGWFVRQFENEYNPLHIHTGGRLSCVGYLKLPEGIEKEWEEDYNCLLYTSDAADDA